MFNESTTIWSLFVRVVRGQASDLSNGMSLLRSEIDDLILYVCCA